MMRFVVGLAVVVNGTVAFAAEEGRPAASTAIAAEARHGRTLRRLVTKQLGGRDYVVHKGKRFRTLDPESLSIRPDRLTPGGRKRLLRERMKDEKFKSTLPPKMRKYLEDRAKRSRGEAPMPGNRFANLGAFMIPSAALGNNPTDAFDSLSYTPTKHSLNKFQTSSCSGEFKSNSGCTFRSQGERGTCNTFATVAAIEAQYKRQYGLNLDLSEQFHAQLRSTQLFTPQTYKYENVSSLWGGGGVDERMVYSAKYLIPEEKDAKYIGDEQEFEKLVADVGLKVSDFDWDGDPKKVKLTQEQADLFEYNPKYISAAARKNAKYGVMDYILLDDKDVRDPKLLEFVLYELGREIVIASHLKFKSSLCKGDKGYDPKKADPAECTPEGAIAYYDAAAKSQGHAQLIVGYDRSSKDPKNHHFLVKNSWGDDHYWTYSYDYIKQDLYAGAVVLAVFPAKTGLPTKALDKAQTEALKDESWALVVDAAKKKYVKHDKGAWIGRWNVNADGKTRELVVRRTTNAKNEATRLGHYYERVGGKLTNKRAVNGYFSEWGRCMKVWIAEVETNEPGTMTGLPMELCLNGANARFASGTSQWKGVKYGVTMSQAEMPVVTVVPGMAEGGWKGVWVVTGGALAGKLSIQTVVAGKVFGVWLPLGATDVKKSAKKVSGAIGASSHIATIEVKGVGNATIYHHSWKPGFFSSAATSPSFFGVRISSL